jgi:RecA-family ATPase
MPRWDEATFGPIDDYFPGAAAEKAAAGSARANRPTPPNGPQDYGFDTDPQGHSEQGNAPGDKPLPFIDMSNWDIEPAPKREWALQDRIPLRQVSLFSGEGSIGKSVALLQLSSAHVLAKDWLGTMPEPGPALYLGAEDEADEVRRRIMDIAAHYSARISELVGHLHLLDFAGQDAILGRADRNGLVQATKLFGQLKEAACDIRPKLISLDTSADIFAGNESDRAQVRQFIGQLRGMAIAANSAIIVASHPSLTGISSGTGLSGSTAWHNSVRSRMYFKPATTDAGEEPDPELRELQFLKNNYGPKAQKILVRWKEGVLVPAQAIGSLDKMAADQNADSAFPQAAWQIQSAAPGCQPKAQQDLRTHIICCRSRCWWHQEQDIRASHVPAAGRKQDSHCAGGSALAQPLATHCRRVRPWSKQAMNRQKREPSNPLPTPCQRGTNTLPTGCVFPL